jgi:hypothetical protein
MKRLRIYLDTSVINFLFADDAPELQKITKDFFDNCVKPKKYEVYISEVVTREINRTPSEEKRIQLQDVIREYEPGVLELGTEANHLAAIYVEEGIIPLRNLDDARHIAIATCNHLDILLSWNFRHLANIRKQFAVKSINEREGYFHPLMLTNPMEVVYNE